MDEGIVFFIFSSNFTKFKFSFNLVVMFIISVKFNTELGESLSRCLHLFAINRTSPNVVLLTISLMTILA